MSVQAFLYLSFKAADYEAPDSNKKIVRKEFLYYEEKWERKNQGGVPLNQVHHNMGVNKKQSLRHHYDQNTGEVDFK